MIALLEEMLRKLNYQDDCINILDTCTLFSSPEQMKEVLALGKELTQPEFLDLVVVPADLEWLLNTHSVKFGCHPNREIAWIHDEENDVHYFFS